MFLESFVEEANMLSSEGIKWTPKGREGPVVSKFYPCNCPVDAMARFEMLNMTSPTGYFGCTFCDHKGVFLNKVKFPLPGEVEVKQKVNDPDDQHTQREETIRITVPQHQVRTDEGIKQAMIAASSSGTSIKGVKGQSALMNLRHFDLARGFSTDDLHPIFLGLVEHHTSLLLGSTGEPYYIGAPDMLKIINNRLFSIKTPSIITRKQHGLGDKPPWKGSEWRNWIWYFVILCLIDLLRYPQHFVQHLALLSNAIFLLSSDSISEADLYEAERCLRLYGELFQKYFGPENMRFNVHVVVDHLVPCVRNWGPVFGHSTFAFESKNRSLTSKITSPTGVIRQVVNRYMLEALVESAPFRTDVSERVEMEIDRILHGKPIEKCERVGDALLFNKNIVRKPSNEERALLEERDIRCDAMELFDKMTIDGMECRTSDATYEDNRSDNSVIYVKNDIFGVVKTIALVSVNNRQECCLFVQSFEVESPVMGAQHVARIVEKGPLTLVYPKEIRNLAIKCKICDREYIMPMANHVEID